MLLWWCATYGFGSLHLPWLQPAWFPHLGVVVTDALSFGAVAVLAWRLGLVDGALLSPGALLRPDAMREYVWLVPPLVVACSYALVGRDGVPGISGSAGLLLSSAVGMLAIGLSEEFGARGPALTALLRVDGPVVACAATSVVFGLWHVGNGLFFGQSAAETAWQVVVAGAAGFLWAGTRLVTGSLLPGVLLHAANDFFQLNSPGAAPFWFQCAVVVFHVAWGGVLIRRARAGPSGIRTPR